MRRFAASPSEERADRRVDVRAREPDRDMARSFGWGRDSPTRSSVTSTRPACCFFRRGRSCTVDTGRPRSRYLARHYRVITFHGRGNGGSGRPSGADAYLPDEYVADALAVLDTTGVDRAAIAGVSFGGYLALLLAALHPERIAGACFIGAGRALPGGGIAAQICSPTLRSTRTPTPVGNCTTAMPGNATTSGTSTSSSPNASLNPTRPSQIEDCVAWGLETTPKVLADTVDGQYTGIIPLIGAGIEALCQAVTCPTLHIHGDRDEIVPHAWGVRLAAELNGDLMTIEGGGHLPQARDPVLVNGLMLDFLARTLPQPPRHRRWVRALDRPKRALYVSSPIGLGHAQRDIAIADQLRLLQPELQIDWLAQHPVTTVLAARRETVHPASELLASESAHIEAESHEHDLHAFQAIRNMDEILVANFRVFQALLEEENYDLVIADEAWDLDYFLHENPEQKRSSFAWMTDFVGWLPMEDGGERESRITSDYNAEMIEHVARFKGVRDRAIFVGDPDDIVPATFGRTCPPSGAGPSEHFDFSGYVTGFQPPSEDERAKLRATSGLPPGRDRVHRDRRRIRRRGIAPEEDHRGPATRQGPGSRSSHGRRGRSTH